MSSPVLVTVANNLRFSIPSTVSGPEICRESLRAAKAISANRIRPTRANVGGSEHS